MITETFILENKDKWEEYKEEINKLDEDILIELITEKPDIISIIDLDKLDGYGIHLILIGQPKLIKDLKPYLHKLGARDIYWVLHYQSKLIKDLEPYLHKIGRWDISTILYYQPKLIKDLKPYLNKLNRENIFYILRNRPELSLFFKYVGTEHEDAAYYCACPSEISKLDEEEKYELSKKMVELLRKEKR